jgi:hypothetical protein
MSFSHGIEKNQTEILLKISLYTNNPLFLGQNIDHGI